MSGTLPAQGTRPGFLRSGSGSAFSVVGGKASIRDASGDAQGWNAAADSLRYEKTGLLLLEDSPAPPESRAEWEAAIAEYFAFERKAKPRG